MRIFIKIFLLGIITTSIIFSQNSRQVKYFDTFLKGARTVVQGRVESVNKLKNADGNHTNIATISLIKNIFNDKNLSDLKKIKIKYSSASISDIPWKSLNFKNGEEFIGILCKVDEEYWNIFGGEYGKMDIRNDKITGTNIRVHDYISEIIDVHEGIKTVTSGAATDLEQAEAKITKLGGEFFVRDDGGLYPPNKTITFNLNPTGALDKNGNQLSFTAVKNALQRAFDEWNDVNNAYPILAISSSSYSGVQSSTDNLSTITFSNSFQATAQMIRDTDNPENYYVFDLAFTNKVWNDPASEWRHFRWNTDVNYPSSYSLYPNPLDGLPISIYGEIENIGPIDLQDITTHELGHFFNLMHTESSHSTYTMTPTQYNASNWWEKTFRRSLENGDKSGVIYQTSDFTASSTQTIDKVLLSARNSVNFFGNYTVPSGKYLEIEAGTDLKFYNGSSLIIYGELKIDGEVSDKPIIDFVSKTSSNGIKVYSGGTANIDYAIIKNAVYGLYATDADVDIFYSDINNCSYGAYITSNSDAYIKGCTFYKNSYGIYSTNTSDIKLTGNRIGNMYNSNSTGILTVFGCDINLYGNVISYNTGKGVYALYGGLIRLGYPYSWVGKNTVVDNDSDELYAGSGNPYVDLCQSSVHDNYGFEIYNYSGNHTISAQSCWFGGSLYASGSVYNFSDLTSQPTWEGATQLDDGSVPKINVNTDIPDKYRGYDGILSLKEKINNLSGTTDSVANNLRDLYSVLRGDYKENKYSERENFYTFLESNVKSKKIKKIEKQASKYQIIWKTLEKDFKEAIKLSEDFLKEATGDDYFEVSMTLANLYNITDKKNQAEKILDGLAKNASKEESLFINELRSELSDDNVYILPKIVKEDETQLDEKVINDEYALNDNYPNPFNPTTTISYQLKESGLVNLKIYNSLGQEVAVLVSEQKEKGIHQITFDANNLTSGIYFYKLQSGNFSVVKKMLLLK